MLSGLWSPPMAKGCRWWNSSRYRSEQRRPCSSTKRQRSPSRSRTARRTAAGMWREAADVFVPASVLRGTTVLPKRRASSRSSFSVTARSMTAARSPSGTSVRRSAVSRSSLSRSSALAVNWTLKRAGASGSTKAVRDGGGRVGRTRGVAAGCVTTRRATSSWGGGSAVCASTRPGKSSVAEARGGAGTATSEGPCRFCGSFRIAEGTSGRGASSATSTSICRVVRCVARSRSATQLSAVSSGTSRARPLRWSRPSRSASRTSGCWRAARATVMRR